MARSSRRAVGRRRFLKGAAVGAAALVTRPSLSDAQTAAVATARAGAVGKSRGR